MSDWKNDRVRSAIEGRNPTVFAELGAAFAVLGDTQFLPGYALALTKKPGVDRLTDLPRAERVRFLADVDLIATAVESVCAARDPQYRRTNVEILGNTHHFLHAHLWPRYEWEPADIVGVPVWAYPAERWNDPETLLGSRHEELRSALAGEVARLRNAPDFRFDV
ncbi:HIT family protein [Nocardia carnea]|uniref:HIT family protein n=1 Tax=Nocardia carnea TaxID=37328 RepID=UPI002457384C|nr:HIT domain-containing protein [Nocardia carnea]